MDGINREKYHQAILGFLCERDNRHLGKAKLLKLLYFLDFDHFAKYDVPVTGDTYVKLPYGPVPKHADEILAEMIRDGLLESETARVFDYAQERFSPGEDGVYTPDVLEQAERDMLAHVCRKWKAVSRHAIVEAAPREAPWIAVEDGEEIPYVYAYYRNTYGELDVSEEEGVTSARRSWSSPRDDKPVSIQRSGGDGAAYGGVRAHRLRPFPRSGVAVYPCRRMPDERERRGE